MRNIKRYKVLFFIMIFTFLFTSTAFAYFPKNNEKSKYSSNILLTYLGYYNPENYDGEKIGDWDREKFLPYVTHLNDKGKADDYYFDSFIMLTLSSPYKGSLGRYYNWVKDSKPGNIKDWQWAMDRPFEENLQLDALEEAMKYANSKLKGNRKAKVFLTLPLADSQSKNFGDVDNDGVSEDLTSLEVREKVVKWYIDSSLSKFYEKKYKNIELSGFYWLQEDLDPAVAGEPELVKYTSKYLNDKGLKLGWIPWSGAGLKAEGNKRGFDFTLIQPNHYFENSTIQRVLDTAQLADKANQGVELEMDERVVTSPWHRQAYTNYLVSGVETGFMKESILAYYQDVYGLYNMYHKYGDIGRKIYEDTYKFAKGTYVAPMGNITGRVLDEKGKPLSGVKITQGSNTCITKDDGKYSFENLSAVDKTLSFEKEGYGSKNSIVQILENETIVKDIQLKKNDLGEETDSLILQSFENENIPLGIDPGGSLTLNSSLNFVSHGNNSVKASFTRDYSDFRVYFNSRKAKDSGWNVGDISFEQSDWSAYNYFKADVYNPSDKDQYVTLEFLEGGNFSYGQAYYKRFKLAANSWTSIAVSIADMANGINGTPEEYPSSKINIKDIARFHFAQRAQEPFNLPNSLYIDNMRLAKVKEVKLPEYKIDLPRSSKTLDINESYNLVVKDISIVDGQNNIVPKDKVNFTSSDDSIIKVSKDGSITAIKEGSAMINAAVDGVNVESIKVYASPVDKVKLKTNNSTPNVLKEINVTTTAYFKNGFDLPHKDVKYTWTLKGDSIKINKENSNTISLTAVKPGKTTVTCTMEYNGKVEVNKIDIKVQK